MRLRLSLFTGILIAAGSLFAQSALAQELDPILHPPEFVPNFGAFTSGYSQMPYYQEDILLMHRSAGNYGGDIDWAAGPRLVLGIPLGDLGAIEFAYFGLYNLNRSLVAPGAATADVGGNTGTGLNNRADYRSVVNNGELNYRCWLTPGFSLVTGFRYLNWHENLNTAFDPVNPFAGVVVPPGSVTQAVHTSNNLYGFQIGAEWKTAVTDRFGLEIAGKTGIFDARNEMDATASVPGFGTFNASASSSRAAFIGELGLIGTYRCTDYLKLRAGYELMWVEGLALAPDQVTTANFAGPSTVSNHGGVFLHGAVMGLEYRW